VTTAGQTPVLFPTRPASVILESMGNSRPRSAGVTAAATLAILGCSSAFFLWGYFLVSLLNAHAEQGKPVYQSHLGLFAVVALVPSGLIALGIRTGIGLFQLRPWARVSALAWAGIAATFCLMIIALRPFETFFIPDRFVAPTESLKQLLVIGFVILVLPVSVWWLFLFRTKAVKEQFANRDQRGQTDEVTRGM
jgi:hypothetical protein